MGKDSKIQWTDHSFNPWVGCTKVSPGCDHCYAEGWAKRSGLVTWGEARRRTSPTTWRAPLRWDRDAARDGVRRRVFCASLADVFDNQVADEWRADLFFLIGQTPHLDWLLLTKRIGNVKSLMPAGQTLDEYTNVWLGISVVNQEEADRDIEKLARIPAALRFLSCEPLLEGIDIKNQLLDNLVDWVIVGGESGAHARAMDVGWADQLRYDCERARTPFFMKQGSQTPNWADFKNFDSFPPALQVREWPIPR